MHRLRGAGYYIGIVVLVAQMTEVVLVALPPRVHSPSWRITFVSNAANTVFMTLLVMFIMTAIAVIANDRRVTFVLAWLSAVAALLFLGFSGIFALDALQMRNEVRQQLAARYDYASAWVLTRGLIGSVGFVILAVAAIRSARGMRTESRAAPQGGKLIVGAMPAPRVEKGPAGSPSA
jgi:hypothetical protein